MLRAPLQTKTRMLLGVVQNQKALLAELASGSDARRRSLFRTLAVRTYLVENGVLSTRMDVRALGDRTEEEPKDRVEVRVPPS